MYLCTATASRLETKGSRKSKINPNVNQVELGLLLDVLGKATQPVDDSQVYHQFCQEDSASSCRFCFRNTAKIRSRTTDSSQTDAEHVRLQGADTGIVSNFSFRFSFSFKFCFIFAQNEDSRLNRILYFCNKLFLDLFSSL